MNEIRVVSATGILGSGFREETLKRAMSLKPDFIELVRNGARAKGL